MRTREVARDRLLTALLVTGVASVVIALDDGSPVRRMAADQLVRTSVGLSSSGGSPPDALPDAAIVALDPRSLRARADWPWPRRYHAEAVRQLDAAGAVVVAFDVDFSSPSTEADDAEFARALATMGRGVLASFRQIQEAPGGTSLEISNVPIPKLARAAAATGSVVVPVDPDGVVRFAPRTTAIAGRPLPSLAAAALQVAGGIAPAGDDEAPLAIDYRRAAPAIPVLSMIDVVESRFDTRTVSGRVVFVGATAAEFQDLWATPLGPARPGVWIQAMAYRTLVAEAAGAPRLTYASTLERVLVVFLLSLAAAALGTISHRGRFLGLFLLALGVIAGSATLLVCTGLLMDPVVPAGALAAHYALGLEGIRRRFRAGLQARDGSLSALVRVGEATARPVEGDGLATALGLLGDVVDARGVALLRAGETGTLDGRRLEWRRRGEAPLGCPDTAAEVLAGRRSRVFEGRIPGTGEPGVAVYTPLHAGDVAVGVLLVERDPGEPLDTTQLRTIATVGAQLALSAENLRLIDGLRRTFETSIEAIGSAVEARDGYTESHCRRLAIFATRMAERLGLDRNEIESIRLGALLHDVGKIGIQDAVLLKPDRFEPVERAEMERHAVIGHEIIRRIHGMSDTTAACVRHHHERFDGGGYPDRLGGEQIPIGARIVAIVDVWDALSTARPYKQAFPQDEVRDLLVKGRGGHFDPALVELFLAILDEEGEEMLAYVREGRPV